MEKCPLCNQTFPTSKDLQEHKMTQHHRHSDGAPASPEEEPTITHHHDQAAQVPGEEK